MKKRLFVSYRELCKVVGCEVAFLERKTEKQNKNINDDVENKSMTNMSIICFNTFYDHSISLKKETFKR